MSTFTGRDRKRTTSPNVRRVERLAKGLITAGGVGTIIAVVLIFVFLVWVVVPLFGGAEAQRVAAAEFKGSDEILASGVDEYRLLCWALFRDGRIRVFRADNGAVLSEDRLVDGATLTSWAFPPSTNQTKALDLTTQRSWRKVAFGYDDGKVQIGDIGFDTAFLPEDDIPEPLKGMRIGEIREWHGGMVEVTNEGQHRHQALYANLLKPTKASDSTIQLIDFSKLSEGSALGTLSADGDLRISLVREQTNLMTGEMVVKLKRRKVPFEPDARRGAPAHLRVSGEGTTLYLVWKDGFTQRYDARYDDVSIPSKEYEKGKEDLYAGFESEPVEDSDLVVVKVRPRLAETVDLVEGEGTVTALEALNSKTTLLVGDSNGAVGAWFPARPKVAPGTVDRQVMVNAHRFEKTGSAVTNLAGSQRSRLVAVGHEDGTIHLLFVTTDDDIETLTTDGESIRALAVAPKQDGLLAITGDRMLRWDLDVGHPSGHMAALFGKVWYEGQEEPGYVWQSTGGSDDFEPKMSLMPLVFGTIKATLYSILIAAPLAILAALFTTEFLQPRLRSGVKSVIEMMASLPSVVLGFIAALVIAPFVQDVLPAALAGLFTVPLALLLGARIWQLLPSRVAIRWGRTPRFLAILFAFPLGVLLATVVGPWINNLFFDGDMKGWLRGYGDAAGGWQFILLPVSALLVGFVMTRTVLPWQREISVGWDRLQCALFDIGKVLVWLAVSYGVAMLLGALLAEIADPRGAVVGADVTSREGGMLGKYVQRNAMIVGFVMGFAVVPIIYTLAEDALSSVPMALREGSLGAGATPWQTATRIVIPTAMSGLFGALMVGLGRAVGETMIVLMATGNTPLQEWNPFNGLRTLSANIATELPEAPKDETHYRVLFMCALVLFALTFLINMVAEYVRRIYRRRFADL